MVLTLPFTVVTEGPEAVNAFAASVEALYCPVTMSLSVRFASVPVTPFRVIAVDLPTASLTLVPKLVLMVTILFAVSIVFTVPVMETVLK